MYKIKRPPGQNFFGGQSSSWPVNHLSGKKISRGKCLFEPINTSCLMCTIDIRKVSCYYTCVCCVADKSGNSLYFKVYPEVFISGHTRRNSVVILVTDLH